MRVVVLDASVIINMKKKVKVADQWEFFKGLEEEVDAGHIAIPAAVIREVSGGAHPDMPGAWARGMKDRLVHPLEPDPDRVAAVMAVAGDVIDATSDREQADPDVVALAMQIAASGHEVTVVEDDFVDRLPIKISLESACSRLGVDTQRGDEFIADRLA